MSWEVKSDVPGRLRVRHPWLGRYAEAAEQVRPALDGIEGVTRYDLSLPTAKLLVQYDPEVVSRDRILDALAGALGELPERRTLSPVPVEAISPLPSARRMYFSSLNLLLAGAAVRLPWLAPAALAGTVLVASRILYSGLRALVVDRRIKVDILDGLVISLLLGFRRPQAAAVMVWVVDVGNALLEATSDLSRRILTDLFGSQPRKVWLLVDGVEVERDVSDLRPRDLIVVRAGEQIPVDGDVVEGEAMIDQQVLTGEASAVERSVGETVLAMTVVLAGRIVVQVREAGESTSAARIVQILERSMDHKVRLQLQSEQFADRMVLPTMGIGALGYGLAGRDAMVAIINADFGTGIRVAAPLALLASLSLAARHGIVIKEGAVLETLPDIDAVVFDKTGTLTHGSLEVAQVITSGRRFTRNKVLAYVAGAEQRFSHPIARAVLRRAEELGLKLPQVEGSTYRVGFGVEVQVDGMLLQIGSRRYMSREEIVLPAAMLRELERLQDLGRSAIFAAVDGKVVGMIEFQASERPEASRLIQVLRETRGVREIHLLSGDHEAATRALAEQLGIETYLANALPEEKAEYVRALQRRGLKVAMVGDGINDSVALSVADVSISLRGGADIATDLANIVFMDGDLAKFDLLFQIAGVLDRNVRRSVVMTVLPNSVLILGALGGIFGIGSSLVLNNVVNLLATLNGTLPYYERLDTDPYGVRPPAPA